MKKNSLQRFTESASASWGPLTTELATSLRLRMEALLQTPTTEDWLSELHEEAAETRELYRDPVHGFILLAHTESPGLYRPPHDHGSGWVVYAVQRGETEMSTYARVHDANGGVRLVKRDSGVVRPGQVNVYLPGDIHDTQCTNGALLLFRLTSCDLKKENVTRYAQRNGVWTDGASCAISA
jgi:predicted metal-dependent enzyme (double-stranded beta helix superfamily)